MNVTWTAITRHPSKDYIASLWKVPGHYLLSLYERNYTIKVFDGLPAALKKKVLSKYKELALKMDLFKEYSYPKPFPPDMFVRLPPGMQNQAYVILGHKNTGR